MAASQEIISTYVSPEVKDIVDRSCANSRTSMAQYLRSLIIKDLIARDLLTKAQIADLATRA